jgi:hypothetical protein
MRTGAGLGRQAGRACESNTHAVYTDWDILHFEPFQKAVSLPEAAQGGGSTYFPFQKAVSLPEAAQGGGGFYLLSL